MKDLIIILGLFASSIASAQDIERCDWNYWRSVSYIQDCPGKMARSLRIYSNDGPVTLRSVEVLFEDGTWYNMPMYQNHIRAGGESNHILLGSFPGAAAHCVQAVRAEADYGSCGASVQLVATGRDGQWNGGGAGYLGRTFYTSCPRR